MSRVSDRRGNKVPMHKKCQGTTTEGLHARAVRQYGLAPKKGSTMDNPSLSQQLLAQHEAVPPVTPQVAHTLVRIDEDEFVSRIKSGSLAVSVYRLDTDGKVAADRLRGRLSLRLRKAGYTYASNKDDLGLNLQITGLPGRS